MGVPGSRIEFFESECERVFGGAGQCSKVGVGGGFCQFGRVAPPFEF